MANIVLSEIGDKGSASVTLLATRRAAMRHPEWRRLMTSGAAVLVGAALVGACLVTVARAAGLPEAGTHCRGGNSSTLCRPGAGGDAAPAIVATIGTLVPAVRAVEVLEPARSEELPHRWIGPRSPRSPPFAASVSPLS